MRQHQSRWGCVWKNPVGNERREPMSGREDGGQGSEDGDERILVDGCVGVGVGDEAPVLQRAMRPERATTALVGNSAPARTADASMMLWGTARAGERPVVLWAGPARGRGSHPWWPRPRQSCGGPRQPLWDGGGAGGVCHPGVGWWRRPKGGDSRREEGGATASQVRAGVGAEVWGRDGGCRAWGRWRPEGGREEGERRLLGTGGGGWEGGRN